MTSRKKADEVTVAKDGLLDTLTASLPKYPKAIGRIAKYILEYPEVAIHQSIAVISELSRSSDASVVRLSNLLGYPGFKAMKLALALEVAKRPTLNISPEGKKDFLLEKTRAAMIAATEETCAAFDVSEMRSIARVINNSNRIDIFGTGGSGIVADYLAFRLQQLGHSAQSFRDASMALRIANNQKKNCVAVGVSRTGLTSDTNVFLKDAKRGGATTIAICDFRRSELVGHSDFLLQTSTVHPRDGDTGLFMAPRMLLVELLASYLAISR